MFIVNVMLTGAASVSAVVYALYLRMVIRYRKEEPFDGSFFKLTIALGIADLWTLLHSYLLVRFPIWGYFHSFYSANNGNPWLARYMGVSFSYLMSAQFIGVFLLAINRWTAIIYPMKYKGLWQEWLTKAILVQYVFPLLLVISYIMVPLNEKYAYVVCLDLPHQCDNGTEFQRRIRDGVLILSMDGSNNYLFTKTIANETTTNMININQLVITGEPVQGAESSYQLFLAGLNIFYLVIIAATAATNVGTIFGLVKQRKKGVIQRSLEQKRQEKDRKAERRLTFASLTVFGVFIGVLLCSLLFALKIVPRMDS